jgi:hypothetical protein
MDTTPFGDQEDTLTSGAILSQGNRFCRDSGISSPANGVPMLDSKIRGTSKSTDFKKPNKGSTERIKSFKEP